MKVNVDSSPHYINMIPLITIITSPKPFSNSHIATIQRNAIQSWKHLGPEVEVILIGNEPGLIEVAEEYKLKHLPDVKRNDSGTPLVSSIFSLAHQSSRSPFLIYVNADILLLPDVIDATKQVAKQTERFLLIGQRWDLDVSNLLDFSPGWDSRIRSEVSEHGSLHLPAGSDYFVFPRELFLDMPNFAIGRAGWDNWMIYNAKQQDWTVVDGTPSIMVIHQNHDYSHLPGGRPHYEQDESRVNEQLAGGTQNLYMVLDCDMQLREGRLSKPRPNLVWALRRAEVWFAPSDGNYRKTRMVISRRFRRLRRRITGSL